MLFRKRLLVSPGPPKVAAAMLVRSGAVIFTELYTTSTQLPSITFKGVVNRFVLPSSLHTTMLLAITTRLPEVPFTLLAPNAPAPCDVYILLAVKRTVP